MKIAVIQHVTFEPPGHLTHWAAQARHEIKVVHPADGESLPTPNDCDLLIVLGGPMSAHDKSRLPWLARESAALEEFLFRSERPVLGICLGAQLIAQSLGGRVFRQAETEIGWHPVNLTEKGQEVFAQATPSVTAFHWHGEAFDLPSDCTALGSSLATRVQGFVFQERVVALQFHPEMNATALDPLLRECGHLIDPEKPFQQSETTIREMATFGSSVTGETLQAVLRYLLR